MDKSIEEIYNKLKNTDEKALNYTVELSKELYERELDRSKWSDDKTNMLLSVIAIIAGLLFLGLKEKTEISMNQYYFILSMAIFSGILLLLSTVFLVLSLKTRPLNFVGDRDIFYIHESDYDINIKRYVASLYLNAYQKNLEVINDKVTDRNIATFFMLPAILAIFVLILFILIT